MRPPAAGGRPIASGGAAEAAALVEPDAAAVPAQGQAQGQGQGPGQAHGQAQGRPQHGPVGGPIGRALSGLNRLIAILASLALVAASVILIYSVAVRYAFHEATYWQDEAAVFLIVGATFLAGAYVQERRGHVGIEAIIGLLPPGVNRVRAVLVDLASLAFCGFFAWKSWTLFHEAWVDGQVTSSTWGPPLAIPYGIMAAGMSLLSFQILLQLAAGLTGRQTALAAIPVEDRH